MLVDTSVWIDFFNGYASAESERLAQAIGAGEPIALPGIVLTEILLGLKTEAEAARLADLLLAFDVVPEPALADYREAARIYRLCRTQGVTIRSTIDCLIAQLAIRDQRSVLTKDRDFSAIARCCPLQLVALS
jgi:predicted nucleic acid-binding protein